MNTKVTDYIKKQKLPQKEICQKLRKTINTTLPGIKEEMKWGVPSFDNGKIYIVALKNHVNFGYNNGSKKMKHIKIESLEKINTKEIERIIRLVCQKKL